MSSAATEDESDDGDWTAVAEAVKARMAALRLKQLNVASRAGVSPATIREITNSPRPRRRYGRTLAALSEALEWPPDHLEAVLTGKAATPETGSQDPQLLRELLAIRAELQSIKQRLDALEHGRPPQR